MMDKRRIEMQEERDDKALRRLMEEYAEAESRALEEAMAEQSIPEGALDALDKHVEALLQASEAQQKRLLFRRQTLQTAKCLAVYALVFLILASTIVMSVGAFKIPLMNFLLENKSRYTTVSFGKDSKTDEETDLVDWILSKTLPDGYSFIKKVVGAEGIVWLLFQNQEGSVLRIAIRLSDSEFNVDTEDAEQTSMKLNGRPAIYLYKNGHRVIWIDADRQIVFEVHADNLEKDEFWKFVYQLAE